MSLVSKLAQMEIEGKLKCIQSSYQFREAQIENLFHCINLVDSSNIVVYGPRATGKTSIVRAIVDQFGLFHASINVLHHLNIRNIYESILSQVHHHVIKDLTEDDSNIHDFDVTCLNSLVFLEKLEIILKMFSEQEQNASHEVYKRKLFIVLDNFDTLLKEDNDEFIYLMNNIEKMSKHACPISVIYICSHSVEWMSRQSEFQSSSLEIVFNYYSTEELLQLFTSSTLPDSDFSKDFYSNYVNIILKSLTPFTRNLVELKNICLTNFQHYIEPIKKDEMTSKDLSRLYLKFQDRLQKMIVNLSDHKTVRLNATVKMSPSISYLLVASYLASYNSIKTDKRYFVRNQGKFKERRKQPKKNNEVESKAPKPFTFERLFAIYQALLNLNENDLSTRKHLNVSSLVLEEFNELIKQNLVFAIKAVNSAPISSVSKFQLSDLVTAKLIDDIAFSIDLNMKAFSEN